MTQVSTVTAFQIKEVENTGLKRAYTIVVAANYIEGKLGEELKRVGEKVRIDGFRKGKVPMQVLKQRYKSNAMGDVLNGAVDEAMRVLIAEHNAVPALRPDVKIETYDDEGDLKLAVNFEIMPQSPDIDYSVVEVQKPLLTISDEDVSKSLNRLAQGKREMKECGAEVKAKTGNVVVIDFKGFLGDEAFAGGEGKGYSLELGSGQFIPGFEEQLTGCKAGDIKEVKATFPADYHSADLAGKETRFEVTVHTVQEVVAAVIDDTLAVSYGYESLDILKGFIREQLEKEHADMARGYLKKQLFDALEKQCQFDVPEAMLTLEFDAIWKQAMQEAKAEGKEEGDVESEREQYQNIAKRRVQLGILLSQTAGRNNLEITQKDMQTAIFEQAKMYPGQEMKILEFFQKNPQQAQELRGPILEEKAVDFILERVTLTDSAHTLDELLEADNAATRDESAPTKSKKVAKKS